jgi:hypothetical protein
MYHTHPKVIPRGTHGETNKLTNCPKPFTGVEKQCLGKSTRVGVDYQYVMKN